MKCRSAQYVFPSYVTIHDEVRPPLSSPDDPGPIEREVDRALALGSE